MHEQKSMATFELIKMIYIQFERKVEKKTVSLNIMNVSEVEA